MSKTYGPKDGRGCTAVNEIPREGAPEQTTRIWPGWVASPTNLPAMSWISWRRILSGCRGGNVCGTEERGMGDRCGTPWISYVPGCLFDADKKYLHLVLFLLIRVDIKVNLKLEVFTTICRYIFGRVNS